MPLRVCTVPSAQRASHYQDTHSPGFATAPTVVRPRGRQRRTCVGGIVVVVLWFGCDNVLHSVTKLRVRDHSHIARIQFQERSFGDWLSNGQRLQTINHHKTNAHTGMKHGWNTAQARPKPSLRHTAVQQHKSIPIMIELLRVPIHSLNARLICTYR